MSRLDNTWKAGYALSIALLFAAVATNAVVSSTTSNHLLGIASMASLASFVCFSITTRLKNKECNLQFLVVNFLLSVFIILALQSPFTDKIHYKLIALEIVSTVPPSIVLAVGLFKASKPSFSRISFWIKNKWIVLSVMAVFVVFSLPTLHDWLYVDSNTYYTYISEAKSFDFTCSSLALMKLGGHRAYGAAFFYVMGEFLFPNNPVGVRLVQIALTCIAIYAVSEIVRIGELDNGNGINNALVAAIFAFFPQVLGTIYSINLDYMMLLLEVLIIHSWIKERHILAAFFSLLLVFSKEVGIVLVLGIFVGCLFCRLLFERPFFSSILKRSLSYAALIIGSFSIFWVFGGAQWFASKDSLSIDATGSSMHSFGINAANIIAKLKQFFLMDFNWILVLMMGVFVVLLLIERKRFVSIDPTKAKVLIPSLTLGVAIICFNFVYITYLHSRYVCPNLFPMLVLFAFLASEISGSIAMKQAVMGSIAVLMVIQSLITIDPVSLAVFKNVNIGERLIFSTNEMTLNEGQISTDEAVLSERRFGHSIEYNRDYAYFGRAFEQTLQSVDYDENTLIAVESIFLDDVDFSSIVMFGKEGGNGADYYYDSQSGNMVYNSDFPRLNLLFISSSDNNLEACMSDFERVYVFSFPYNRNREEFSSICDFKTVGRWAYYYRGWEVDVVRVK